ncbi:MAG: hypothetical protein SCH39_12150 [Methanosarcinales archaeon]|nr:hypothetical protein [Methanosarcinales archaeon]
MNYIALDGIIDAAGRVWVWVLQYNNPMHNWPCHRSPSGRQGGSQPWGAMLPARNPTNANHFSALALTPAPLLLWCLRAGVVCLMLGWGSWIWLLAVECCHGCKNIKIK